MEDQARKQNGEQPIEQDYRDQRAADGSSSMSSSDDS